MNKYISDLVLRDAKDKGQSVVKDYDRENCWLIYNLDNYEKAFIEFFDYTFVVVSHTDESKKIHSEHDNLLEAINKIKEMK